MYDRNTILNNKLLSNNFGYALRLDGLGEAAVGVDVCNLAANKYLLTKK